MQNKKLKISNHYETTLYNHRLSFLHKYMGKRDYNYSLLRKYSNEKRIKDDRSLSLEPTAFLNGNMLCIHTNLPVEYLQIVVTDSFNNTVYSNNDATCSRSHIFELNPLPKGKYIVSLTIGDESFYGHFSKYDI